MEEILTFIIERIKVSIICTLTALVGNRRGWWLMGVRGEGSPPGGLGGGGGGGRNYPGH